MKPLAKYMPGSPPKTGPCTSSNFLCVRQNYSRQSCCRWAGHGLRTQTHIELIEQWYSAKVFACVEPDKINREINKSNSPHTVDLTQKIRHNINSDIPHNCCQA